MRILIAPNAFKGTLTAAEAGAAVAEALEKSCPGAAAKVLPIADGGDGLLDALRPALGGRVVRSRVEGPLGAPVDARWLLAGRTAVIEMAEASGLRLLKSAGLRPLKASTRGVGQLMAAAVKRGAREIIVGLGGSASNDGGAGCAEGFGFLLLNRDGQHAGPGAAGLASLAAIFPGKGDRLLFPSKGTAVGKSSLSPLLKVVGLADVSNPLCGRLGSARIYGPQKGAGPAVVRFMEGALLNYSRVVKKYLGRDVSRLKGGAAAGGLGAGLAAFFGAELLDGAAFVLGKTGFERELRRADLLITGEGCFDRQTFYGKAPGAAIAAAARLGKPVIVVCGRSLIKGKARLAGLGVAGVIEALPSKNPASGLRLGVERALPKLVSGLGI